MLDLINDVRPLPVKISPILESAAFSHAIWMATTRRLRHSNTGTLIKDFPASAYAENIAFGYNTLDLCFKAWMRSTGHRNNILNPLFDHIGLGFSGSYWCLLLAKEIPNHDTPQRSSTRP